jgi:hypothetical protein
MTTTESLRKVNCVTSAKAALAKGPDPDFLGNPRKLGKITRACAEVPRRRERHSYWRLPVCGGEHP